MSKGRFFRIICGIMILIISVILVQVFVSDDNNGGDEVDGQGMQPGYYDPSRWMESLSDDTYLSEITIPGTHDSAARYVMLGYVMRCQDTSIYEQLDNGYRYLDLRIALDKSKKEHSIKLVHNFANCHVDGGLFSNYLHLEDVTKDIYTFLQKYKDETVIVNFKIEDDEVNVKEIQKLLNQEITSNKDYWFTEEYIPTLGEARGRAVLATRFDDIAGTGVTGLNMIWAEQDNKTPVDIPYELYVNDEFRYWVQDRYKYSVEDKYEAVVDGLENCEADEDTWFLNFVSTSGDGKIGHPKGYANSLNGLLMDYSFKENTSYGIIIVDFGNAELARRIYLTNSF